MALPGYLSEIKLSQVRTELNGESGTFQTLAGGGFALASIAVGSQVRLMYDLNSTSINNRVTASWGIESNLGGMTYIRSIYCQGLGIDNGITQQITGEVIYTSGSSKTVTWLYSLNSGSYVTLGTRSTVGSTIFTLPGRVQGDTLVIKTVAAVDSLSSIEFDTNLDTTWTTYGPTDVTAYTIMGSTGWYNQEG